MKSKNKKLITLIILIITVLNFLSGCIEKKDDKTNEIDRFIGSWIGSITNCTEIIYIDFYSNFTVYFSSNCTNLPKSWNNFYFNSSKICINPVNNSSVVYEYWYNFSNNNKSLVIQNIFFLEKINNDYYKDLFIGAWKNFLPFKNKFFYSGYINGYTEWTFYENGSLKQIVSHTPFSMGIGTHHPMSKTYWYDYSIANNYLKILSKTSNHSYVYRFDFELNRSSVSFRLSNIYHGNFLIVSDHIIPNNFKLYRVDNTIFVELKGTYKEDKNNLFFDYLVDENNTQYKINKIGDFMINKTLIIKGFMVLPVKNPHNKKWANPSSLYHPGYIQILDYSMYL